MRSVVVVLPASMWAMMPMLRSGQGGGLRPVDFVLVTRGGAAAHMFVGFRQRSGYRERNRGWPRHPWWAGIDPLAPGAPGAPARVGTRGAPKKSRRFSCLL